MKKTKLAFIMMLLWAATLSAHAQSWSLTGNSGTNPATHFIGTKDLRSLEFRTNNSKRMLISPYGGLQLIDPGVTPNASHPYLLYAEKASQGTGIIIHMTSSTNPSSAFHVTSKGTGSTITAIASQAGSAGVYAYNSYGFGIKAYSERSWGLVASTNYSNALLAISPANAYAGYFISKVFASGGYYAGSDQKLKQNIADVSSAMGIIHQLHPKKYHYRQDGPYKLMKLPQEEQYGLLAQEVEKVLPSLVKDSQFDTALAAIPQKPDANGKLVPQPDMKSEIIEFKALNYMGLIPIMIKGMQEQQAQIQAQQEKIKSQDEKIEKLSAQVDQLLRSQRLPANTGMLQDNTSDAALLTQNAPNPFHQSTTIYYHIPQQADKASVHITDMKGTLLKTFSLITKGDGHLELEGGMLAPGTYQYTLVVNGQVMDTKKLILLK